MFLCSACITCHIFTLVRKNGNCVKANTPEYVALFLFETVKYDEQQKTTQKLDSTKQYLSNKMSTTFVSVKISSTEKITLACISYFLVSTVPFTTLQAGPELPSGRLGGISASPKTAMCNLNPVKLYFMPSLLLQCRLQ